MMICWRGSKNERGSTVSTDSLQIVGQILGRSIAKTNVFGGLMRNILSQLATAMLAIVLAGPSAFAQTSLLPPDIAAKLKELGRIIDPPKTQPLLAPLHEKEPYAGVKVERDIKYGSDERHVLDIFTPETAGTNRPVLIFVHGGGFVAGNKRSNPTSPFFDNIMLWAARNGMVGVNMTYRLAPQFVWPAGSEDTGAAVRWVAANVASRGGDASRIFLAGHSAGAVHVANYVAHPQFHGPGGVGLAGVILISGLYDLTMSEASTSERTYFGTDASLYKDRSSLAGLLASKVPLMITIAELDPPNFEIQFNNLKDKACATRGCPRTFVLPEHSHISETYSINTKDTRLADELLAFVKTGK
jgi:acetyl esterase/lipase